MSHPCEKGGRISILSDFLLLFRPFTLSHMFFHFSAGLPHVVAAVTKKIHPDLLLA
jgi:hypothetical protein